jgi:hypothetical protein
MEAIRTSETSDYYNEYMALYPIRLSSSYISGSHLCPMAGFSRDFGYLASDARDSKRYVLRLVIKSIVLVYYCLGSLPCWVADPRQQISYANCLVKAAR